MTLLGTLVVLLHLCHRNLDQSTVLRMQFEMFVHAQRVWVKKLSTALAEFVD